VAACDLAFWDYSLQVYARTQVATALIRLQDQLGADVNVMLWCCWLVQCRNTTPERGALEAATAAVAPWREAVVEPLRALRRRIKSAEELRDFVGAQTARDAVLAAELAAEKAVQLTLESLLSNAAISIHLRALPGAALGVGATKPQLDDAIVHTLVRYLRLIEVAEPEAPARDLAELL